MFLSQTFSIDPISILLVVGFLCAIAVGAIRGFFHVLIDLGQSILSLIVSVILAKPLGMLLYNTGYFNNLIIRTSNFLVERDAIFTQIITDENINNDVKINLYLPPYINEENIADVLSQAFDKLNVPDRLNSVMITVGEKIIPNTNDMKIADFISETLFVGVAIFLAATLLYLLIFIVVLIFHFPLLLYETQLVNLFVN